MARPLIRPGDKTSHGGTPIARMGDKTACGAVLIAGRQATIDNP
jgi:uncharacterized Zn-binding protein involved in type VI secretion